LRIGTLTPVGKGILKLGQVSFIFTAIISLSQWVYEAPVREKQTNYAAWQVVESAKDQPANGGRIEALQDLNRTQCYPVLGHLSPFFCSHHPVTLTNLAAQQAFLEGVNLSHATIESANFSGACLSRAILDGADLQSAILTSAHLTVGYGFAIGSVAGGKATPTCSVGDSQKARERGASLIGANLERATFTNALLGGVKLQHADLSYANIQNASLGYADLTGAKLDYADMEKTSLDQVDLAGASLVCVRNLTPDQVKAANNWQSATFDAEFALQLGAGHVRAVACAG
jgi:uncharacterized protein YjbI with pentapeptide repeats